jgi:hypothetical protein
VVFPVLIVLDNPDGLLRPGMNGTVEILVAQYPDALTIPATAVVQRRQVVEAATIVNAGATFATGNDLDNAGAGVQTSGGYGTFSEPFIINGDGYLGQGALRKMTGREQDTLGGSITLGSNSRVQADFSTFQLNGALSLGAHDLALTGSTGFVSIGGVVSGTGDLIHYGLSGFRLQNNGNTFTGAINSTLGEIRGDTGDNATANNPYDTISALNLRNSALRLNFPNAAGPSAANSRFSATAPVTMRSSQLYIDNASFSGTATNQFDYALSQGFGATTLTGGGNKITARSADAGSVTLTFADLSRPNAGTTLELQIDSLIGGAAADWGGGACAASRPAWRRCTFPLTAVAVPAMTAVRPTVLRSPGM